MRSRHEILESLLRNTASNAVASGCSIALEILTFAVLVRLLAPADYGMYIMAAGLAGHFSIVELGVGRSIERFLPEFVVQGRRDDVPRAVAFAMACHGALGAFAALSVLFTVAGWLSLRRFGAKGAAGHALNRRSEQVIGRTGAALDDFRNGEGVVVVDDVRWSARLASGEARKGAALRITAPRPRRSMP